MIGVFAATLVIVPNSNLSAETASDSGAAIGKVYFAVFAAVFRARAMFVSMSQACFRFAGAARPVPASGDPRKIVLHRGAG